MNAPLTTRLLNECAQEIRRLNNNCSLSDIKHCKEPDEQCYLLAELLRNLAKVARHEWSAKWCEELARNMDHLARDLAEARALDEAHEEEHARRFAAQR